ncbi:N-acetylglucosaminyldiphosphoundecaprenol N-acetyl-beta-D-mannosaminyltransferase [Caldanaerobacter subterraneus subsp. tengcongensis MB4]|uniref:N-acetylglucosaminyldiphosphoundecaprenol N-acetyl-beta-D-mannosaminyltransferase n=1 Tax=Caldanaerobacter subterraneus subsp. tengcongensis (strain DSM 15242 / JCM 11007 / NBRC 100824 / MB4) TaxID=273068 RepID=Q8R864_CALS4|nr:WecB/TagA/CpsF family glycosyltransferase [Caldanaerobacter subterraneus]AAM25322.1 Teichoic acid biosynthesis proteins [Caldanaerobacter subterraneus subsp. tengcongensis MB4]MCS3915074.1 N-acetylglucosaminyldiphosphoundecaprenol N-acetyl-beta-D-mannosaminyltransferase [Caldanaerobacter subterraneus subsp. tengcongensis MB4]
MDKLYIFGVPIHRVTMIEAVEILKGYLKEDRIHIVATPNAEIIMMAQKDEEYKKILNETDLNVPDGSGVVFASRVFNKPLKERVAGFDLMMEFVKWASHKDVSIYLLGAKPEVVEKAQSNLKNLYPSLKIVGFHHGYFNEKEEENIIEDINKRAAQVLFVALGAPKQEKWIYKNKEKLKVKIAMGVGGSFDVIAGKAKRAPEIYRKLGLEWLYRLIQEPWRYKRMSALPKFAFKVLLARLKGDF